MPKIHAQFTLAFKTNGSHDTPTGATLRVTDTESGVVLVESCLTSGQFVALLASASVDLVTEVPPEHQLSKIGKHRAHHEHLPPSGVLNLDTDNVTLEMIAYGDAYREQHGWDSATWHRHTDGRGWCLHLVRWEDAQL